MTPTAQTPQRVAHTFAALLLVASSATLAAPAPFEMDRLDVDYRFENDGTYTHTVRARIHVTSEEGRRTLGEFYFPYQSRSSRLELRYMRTVKPSGDWIEAAPDEMFDVAPPAGQRSPVFSDLMYKAIPVPGLQVGDRIEYELVRTIHQPLAPGQFWGHHSLTRRMVVGRETVRLDLPANRTLAFVRDRRIDHTSERRNKRMIHTWTHRNPVPRRTEDNDDYLFNLSTFRTWPELGAWMDGLIADRATGDPALTALAREIVGDATDPRVQTERLYTYVSQQVRYVQVRLGIGSYQPHAATEVQRNLYGDCKDKHTLLAVLLDAVGVESRPALVHSTRTVDPRVPTPEAFNHMITRVDLGDEPLWLDATEELAPAGWLTAELRGSRALAVQRSGSKLQRLPSTVPVADSRRAVLRGSFDMDGGLRADLRIEHRGSFEIGWRNLFHKGNRGDIRDALQIDRPRTLRTASASGATTSDPLDTSGPFVVEYSLEQPAWIDPRATTPTSTLPSMILNAFAQATPAAAGLIDEAGEPAYGDLPSRPTGRSNDGTLAAGDLGGPLLLEEQVFLATPAGLAIETPPDVHDDRGFAIYTATYTMRDGVLEATRTLEIANTGLSPAQRNDVRGLVRSVQADLGRPLLVKSSTDQLDDRPDSE